MYFNIYLTLKLSMELKQHGAYGVTVNTEVCGTSDESSILSRHPKIRSETTIFLVRAGQ